MIENALHDPIPEVRRRNLEILASRWPTADSVQETFARGLLDSAPLVQVVAAEHAPLADGANVSPFSVLKELINERHAEEIRAAAARVLGRRYERARAIQLLTGLLHDRSTLVRRAAAEALAANGWAAEQGALALAEGDGGELSLASESGQLSVYGTGRKES